MALRGGIPAIADALLGSLALPPLDEVILASVETITPAAVASLDPAG